MDDTPDLTNKSVYIVTDHNNGLPLTSITFEQQGGKLFMVGTVIEGFIDGFDGKRACVAWDKVLDYAEFSSKDECVRAALNIWESNLPPLPPVWWRRIFRWR